MKNDTFARVEDKYQLTPEQMHTFIHTIQNHIKDDIYTNYTVHSVYLDSDDNDLIIRSLNRDSYKHKIRLRSYQNPNDDTQVYLEIKKKYRSVVYKSRIGLQYQEAQDYLYHHQPLSIHNQTTSEIDYLIHYYTLKPKVLILYDRICYVGKEETDVRITFDSNIRYRLEDVSLKENGNERLLAEGKILMEIKALNRYPFWLLKALEEQNIQKQPFSKYGNIYTQNFNHLKLVEHVQQEEISCSILY